MKSFEIHADKIRPTIQGHFAAQNNTVELEFNTIQTRNNIQWIRPHNHAADKTTKRQDNLWKYTCFELFVANTHNTGYREFNFAPNGCWNSYDFNDYREEQHLAELDASPQIKYDNPTPDTHLLSVQLPLSSLITSDVTPRKDTNLQLGVSAVILYTDESLDYYALKHCGPQADFHLRSSFTLQFSFNPLN